MVKKVTFFFVAILVSPSLYAAGFFCAPGNVRCLSAAIIQAHSAPAENTTILEPGISMVTMIDNDRPTDLPSITNRITIRGTVTELKFIERDAAAPVAAAVPSLTKAPTVTNSTVADNSSIDAIDLNGDGGCSYSCTLTIINGTVMYNSSMDFSETRGDRVAAMR